MGEGSGKGIRVDSYIASFRIELSRQSSPKGGNERLMLCIAALRALQHNRLLFVGIFALSGGEPFNHEGVTLFTHHGCLPSKFLCDSFRRRGSFLPSRISDNFSDR